MNSFIKFIIDKFVKNEKWTRLGKYMEPKNICFQTTIKDGWGGYCSYNLFSCDIRIKTKYVTDEGIKKHELAHARQYGRLFWLHLLLRFWGKYKLLIELEAYRHQVAEYGYKYKSQYLWIIKALNEKYHTNVPLEDIVNITHYVFEDILNKQ